jgi:hypothetical protein
VRTKKRIVVIQAQFAFTDVLVDPSPPSRACVGGHRGSTSAHWQFAALTVHRVFWTPDG